MPFGVFRHAISELAGAPVIDLVDGSLAGGNQRLELVHKRVDLLLRRIRLHDKQLFVDSHSSSCFKPPARRLNIVMDFSTPSAIMDSIAAHPCATISSTSCICAFLNGASTNFAPSPIGRSGLMPKRTLGNSFVPKLPITLFTPLCPASDPFGRTRIVFHGSASSSYTRIKRPGVNSYRSSKPFTDGPLKFMKVCGLATTTGCSLIVPWPTNDIFSLRLSLIPK